MSDIHKISLLIPDWPAPSHIKALTTLRQGGVSPPPFHSLNLGHHSGDNLEYVKENRHRLIKEAELPAEPIWLEQIHSNIVLTATPENRFQTADASYTDKLNHIAVVLTADCLPILLCNQTGTRVAAIHAGWQGIAKGIIPATLTALNVLEHQSHCTQKASDEWLAWIGPGISHTHFEIQEDTYLKLSHSLPQATLAFTPCSATSWYADLYKLSKEQLIMNGVTKIYGGNFCTYEEKDRFFSYRRDNGTTGRMATMIWISSSPFTSKPV